MSGGKKLTGFMTVAQAAEHQRRHGFVRKECAESPTGKHSYTPDLEYDSTGKTKNCEYCGELPEKRQVAQLPQPVKMSRPEKEMGMMLEAQKRAAEIVDYRFQGMSLAYSPDPETGILLRYKCDYVVIERLEERKNIMDWPLMSLSAIKIIECKGYGKHAISAAAKLRFKGAKAAWPMFQFEMHQRCQDGQWRRVL